MNKLTQIGTIFTNIKTTALNNALEMFALAKFDYDANRMELREIRSTVRHKFSINCRNPFESLLCRWINKRMVETHHLWKKYQNKIIIAQNYFLDLIWFFSSSLCRFIFFLAILCLWLPLLLHLFAVRQKNREKQFFKFRNKNTNDEGQTIKCRCSMRQKGWFFFCYFMNNDKKT